MLLQRGATRIVSRLPNIERGVAIFAPVPQRFNLPFKKEPIVDPALYDQSNREPISASVGLGDLATERDRRFADDIASITAKGFLRFQKGYEPAPNSVEKFLNLVRSVDPKLSKESDAALMKMELNDPNFKYDILTKAASEFQHSVPNSLLSVVRTIGAAAVFYSTPISNVTPFDELARMDDLPPNLHIQKEYVRFDPDTAQHFKGITAFPKESTVITGLRAKQKYKAFKPQKIWTTDMDRY